MPIARRQPSVLLYRLAAEVRPARRSQLCYFFWPDVPDVTARRNLTRLLVLLRTALPTPALLLAEDEFITLDRQQLWSDTVEMARLLATSEPAMHIVALTQAVDLYRGPFWDGFALLDCPEFEAWLEGERRVWERRLFDVLAALIEAHTVARDYAAAITVAHRYLQRDELAEDVHRRLIAPYAAQARFVESLLGFRTIGQTRGLSEPIAGLASLLAYARTRAGARRAARLWGAADAIYAAERAPIWPADRAEHRRYQALARATIGDVAFDVAYAEGSAIPLDEACAMALQW